MVAILLTGQGQSSNAEVTKYQGKTIQWWARHAVQARKDANKRGATIARLRGTLHHSTTISESIKLATLTYPAFTEHRAWCIINHEDHAQDLYARNPTAVGRYAEHATGLYQFLPSTFNSTPYRGMSMYSALAQSLAAGWMHQHGRGKEWAGICW